MKTPTSTGHRSTLRRVVAASLTVILATAVGACIAGCGPRGGLSDRYVAEKMAWRAQKLRRAMVENPDVATEQMQARLRSAYGDIVRLFPPPERGPASLTDIERDVAVISGMSRLRLAALAEDSGDADEAQRLYTSVVDSYSFSRSMSVEASTALAASYEAAGMVERAARVLMETAEKWDPAESRDAPPDLRILRAPILAATSLVSADLEERGPALDDARAYYRRLVDEWEGTPTARAALGVIAESYELESRWADAAQVYERFDRDYSTAETRPALLLRLGDLYSGRMGDVSRAAEYYREVERLDPQGLEGATAAIALARFDLAARRYDEARQRLESVVSDFPDENMLAATASQLLATSYEAQGKLDTAIARYGRLSASYPTTMYGLAAPLHVAELYSRMGEDAASATALDRAVEHYERIIRDYADTPAEMAARSYLIAARTELEDWQGVASLLLETAQRQPGAPASAGMLLQAADIYETRLDDRTAAVDVLKKVNDMYAGSEAADEAQQRLERLAQ